MRFNHTPEHFRTTRVRLTGLAIALVLVLGSRSFSQENENSLICKRLQQRYDVEFLFAASRVSKCTWKLDYQFPEKRDQKKLNSFLKMFEHEFSKYPPEFVKKTRLKQVVFVKSMKLGTAKRWAIPDYFKETLYYDFTIRSTAEYPRRMVHHEYYNMIEQQINGNGYFKDPKWAKFNEKGFKYGRGGASNRKPSNSLFNHPQPGFVNSYAMSGLEEDKAEIWAVLFVTENWNTVKPWLDDDEILRKKVEYTERFAKQVCREMGEGYWEAIRKPKASSNGSPKS